MNQPILTVMVSGLLACVPALSSAAVAPLRLEVDNSARYALVDVVQATTEKGLAVEGLVEKRGMEFGKIHGDVDVDLLTEDGKVLATRQAGIDRFGPSPKNPSYGHFSVVFAWHSPDAKAIRVRYHPEPKGPGGILRSLWN